MLLVFVEERDARLLDLVPDAVAAGAVAAGAGYPVADVLEGVVVAVASVVDAEVNIRDNRVLLRSAAQSTGASRRSSTPTPSSTCASSASTSPAPSRSPTNGIRLAKDRRFVAELAPLKPDIYLQFDPTAGCGSGASRANRGRFSWGATDA